MKKWQGWTVAVLTALCLCMPLTTQAAEEIGEEPEEIATSEPRTDTSRADDWFSKQDSSSSEKGALGRALDSKRQQNGDANKKVRYVYLLEDNGFAYYMDTRSAK